MASAMSMPEFWLDRIELSASCGTQKELAQECAVMFQDIRYLRSLFAEHCVTCHGQLSKDDAHVDANTNLRVCQVCADHALDEA